MWTAPTIPSTYITEYDVTNEYSSPDGIAVDPSGNVWFVIQNGSSLGVLYSSNSTVHAFPIPSTPVNGLFLSYSVAVDSSRDLVWFADDSGLSQGIWSFSELTYKFHFYNMSTSFPYLLFVDKVGNV